MSLAAYVPKTKPTQSAFSELFKRSKFATFDPQIAQVYTTYGGDAKRGNWGFKRPLPLRRRGAYITVKAVDSHEQQTEWNSAESQALWMKNWQELKLTAVRGSSDSLGKQSLGLNYANAATQIDGNQWIVDSDYTSGQSDPVAGRGTLVPNIHAMSRRRFKSYIEHIRAQRGEFYEYLQADGSDGKKKAGVSGLSYYQIANSGAKREMHEILAKQASEKRRTNSRSREIEQVPHRTAGLTYTHFSPLQTYLMTEAQPGRLLEEYVPEERGRQPGHIAGFARMTAFVKKGNQGTAQAMDWNSQEETGVTKFRAESAILRKVPNVVGVKREGLKAARIDLDLRSVDMPQHERSNTHRPGSRKYISQAPAPTGRWVATSMTTPRRRVDYAGLQKKQAAARDQQYSGATLDRLKGLLGTPNPDGTNDI